MLIETNKKLIKSKSQKVETDIFNFRSKEFYINLSEKDIPPKGHPDRDAFISYEEDKCLMGVNINGVFIPPTLYWDLNHWAIAKDVINSRGIISKEIGKPDLRDNDWIIHNALYEAEKEKKHLIEGTARQLGKSKNKGSIVGRDLMLIENCEDLLLCGNSNDLTVMMKYILVGTSNCTDFFRVPRLTYDKKATLYKWGHKNTSGEEDVYSYLHVRNAQDGIVTEVSAGVSIYRAILDETGKYNFRSSYETIEPATRSEFGIRAASILSFTGGDVDKSKDSQELFLNPSSSNFKEFDNEEKKTGLFIGGWYRQDLKVKTTLGNYLNLKEDNELYNFPIGVTDFDLANKTLDAEIEAAAKSADPTALIKKKMYNPRTISDMFLTPNTNPYPLDALQRHREWLRENPQGTPVELFKKPNGTVEWKPTNKIPIPEYPLRNKLIDKDAPIMIYDFPKHTDHYSLHISGADPFNEGNTVSSDSLGAIYVIRRQHSDITDPYQKCIVASYVARPNDIKIWNRNVELLQEFYNMSILHENSGNSLLQYFDGKNKGHVFFKTFSLAREINPNTKVMAPVGLKANKANHEHGIRMVLDYMNEELEDGSLGLTRIPDPVLIDEYIAYDGFGEGTKNVDRHDACNLAIVHLYALSKLDVSPIITTYEAPEKRQVVKRNAFGFVKSDSKIINTSSRNAFGF